MIKISFDHTHLLILPAHFYEIHFLSSYFLYVIMGPVGTDSSGVTSVRWAEMGEATPTTSGIATEWFHSLARALRSLYKANHAWTSR